VAPPKYLNNGIFFEIAANLLVAIETAKIEFAPNFFFFAAFHPNLLKFHIFLLDQKY
jgi:hypothetical protein